MSDLPIILSPGPVAVSQETITAIQSGYFNHRSDEFHQFFSSFTSDLEHLFQHEGPVVPLLGTGTFAVETTIRSIFNPEDKVIIPSFGKFSSRWESYAKAIGLKVITLNKDWGEVPGSKELNNFLKLHPDAKGVILTHCETSTGATIDLEETTFMMKRSNPDIVIVVDAMSTIGVIPYYQKQWGVDVTICSSAKALANPVGLSFISITKVLADTIVSTNGSSFCDFKNYLDFYKKNEFPYSTPVHLMAGVARKVKQIKSEGLASSWAKSHRLKKIFISMLKKSDLEIKIHNDCISLTVFSIEGISMKKLIAFLKTKENIHVGAGQGPLLDKVIRIAHFGEIKSSYYQELISGIKNYVADKNRSN